MKLFLFLTVEGEQQDAETAFRKSPTRSFVLCELSYTSVFETMPADELLCRTFILCYCCCLLFRTNCPALLWLLLSPKSRPCPGRSWPFFLAVSCFCQMTSLASPPMASWGGASRQSAKQTVCCLWYGECGAMARNGQCVSILLWRGCRAFGASAAIKLLTPRGSLPLAAKSSGGVGQIQEKESALCIHAHSSRCSRAAGPCGGLWHGPRARGVGVASGEGGGGGLVRNHSGPTSHVRRRHAAGCWAV